MSATKIPVEVNGDETTKIMEHICSCLIRYFSVNGNPVTKTEAIIFWRSLGDRDRLAVINEVKI